jgi:hypothetical protein
MDSMKQITQVNDGCLHWNAGSQSEKELTASTVKGSVR